MEPRRPGEPSGHALAGAPPEKRTALEDESERAARALSFSYHAISDSAASASSKIVDASQHVRLMNKSVHEYMGF